MADYFQVKNQNIFNPPANTSLGNATNQFSNVYADSTLILGNVTVTGSTIITPRITTITYPGDDTAADPAGGQTITLTGSGFVAGATILINSIPVSVVSVVSFTEITFTSPANSSGSYVMYVINTDGSTAISIPGIQYSGTPTWTTAAGTLGSLYETASFTESVIATGDAPITYSVFSGTLPPGATFNGNGTITGTSQLTASPTTYTFTVRASDAEQQDTDRSFSLTINTDVVTWVTPAAGSTTTLGQDISSTTTLLATSAAGKAITYTANALPTGLSISGATVTGTPTIVGNTASLFTATAATTGRTTTATINWTISVANDPYFMYTPLLLSGGTSTSTFIADASTNNFALTITGDTKPNNFNPYTPGYYSNYFDGSGDYLSVAAGNAAFAFGTGDFTVELWVYPVVFGSVSSSAPTMVAVHDGANSTGWQLYLSDGQIGIRTHYNNVMYLTASMAAYLGVWTHIAYVRSSGTQKIYMNGVEKCSTSEVWNWTDTALRIASQAQDFNGYLSNVRLVKGTALYTAAFTPPTAPLTAIANTSVLTCQSNRFIDNSTNAFTIAVTGNSTVNPNNPFVPNTAYATQGSTYFDGTVDNLTVATNAVFNFGTGDFTLEAWIYRTASGSDAFIMSASGSGGLFWGIPANGDLGWGRAGVAWDYQFASGMVINRWYHVALTRSGTSMKMFVNGTQLGVTQNIATSYDISTTALNIGSQGANYYFTGYISNVRVVKGVAVYTANFTLPTASLSATQSANTNGNPSAAITGSQTSLLTCQTNQPASNSMFLDSSTNAFPVTRAGNTSAGTGNPYGANWSNYFDGTGQSFYNSSFTGANFGTSNFTIEMWVLWTTSAASNQTVIEFTGTRRIIIGRSSTGIRYFNDGTERGYTVTVPVGTWNHIAIVRVSNTTNIYLNGVSGTSFVDNVNWAETQFYVGRNSDGVELTSAMYLSNLRVVNGTAVYTSNFAIPTAPLTAISGTTLLICKSNSFIDNSANAFGVTLIGTPSVQRFNPFSPQTQTAITNSVYYGTKTDYISTPATAALTTFTGDFTFECWVNPTDTSISTNWGIWDSRQDGQTASGMIFTLQNLASPVTGQWRLSYYYYGTQTYGTGTVLANQWTHVAFVRSGSTLTYYVNGVAGGTATVSGTQTGSATSNPVYIGTKDGSLSGYGTVGYISNFRIVKGVAVYTGNFTVPTAPLTATQSSGTNIAAITGTQTSLLTCQSSTLIDNSTNAYVLTPATTTVKPRTYNPLGFTNTLAGYSAATYGGSAYFDTSGDYIAVTGAGSWVNFGTNDFTIECWCYHTNGISFFDTCPSGNPTPTNRIQLQVSGGGTVTYTTYQGTTTLITSSSGVALPNQWVHLALVKYSNQTKLYVNGTQVGSTYSDTLNYPAQTNRPILNANGYDNSAGTSVGYISDMRIVKGTAVYKANFVAPAAPVTAITNTSLLLNMTSAGVYDSASINNLETVADAKILSTQTPYAGSYYSNYFDGSGDWLTAPASSAWNFTGDWTWECWVYPTAFTGYHTFLGQWQSGNLVFIWKMNSSGRMYLENLSTAITATTTTIVANQWQHIALTRSSNTIRMFVNGVMDATTATRSGTYYSTAAMYVGASGAGEPFTGYISNMRVVNGTALYTGTFTPPTAPLTAIANTSLLTCQSNRFLDNSTYAFTITKNGDTSVQSFNPFQRNSAATMYFDGTGDYLTVPATAQFAFGTGDFTIECWAYGISGSNNGLFQLSASSSYFGGQTGIAIGVGTSNLISIYYAASSNIGSTGPAAIQGRWNHFALVRSSQVLKLYLNGVLDTTFGTAGAITNTTNYAYTYLTVGGYYSAGYLWNGYINDFRITKGIARYTTNFTPPTTAFLTY